MPDIDKLHFDALVIWRSVVNGAPYDESALGVYRWEFPKSTWFQRRLNQVRHGGHNEAQPKDSNS